MNKDTITPVRPAAVDAVALRGALDACWSALDSESRPTALVHIRSTPVGLEVIAAGEICIRCMLAYTDADDVVAAPPAVLATVRLSHLRSFVRAAKDGAVALLFSPKRTLRVEVGPDEATLPTWADTLPPMCPLDTLDPATSAAACAPGLHTALTQVLWCIGEPERGIGVVWLCPGVEGFLRAVATNGRAMATAQAVMVGDLPWAPSPLPGAPIGAGISPLLARTVQTLTRRVGDDDVADVEVHLQEGRICFVVGAVRVWAPLLAATFPSWESVLPDWRASRFRFDVDRADLVARVRALKIGDLALRAGTADAKPTAVFETDDDDSSVAIRVDARAAGFGVSACTIDVRLDDELPPPPVFGLDLTYLAAALGVLDSVSLRIQAQGALSPLLVTPSPSDVNDDDALAPHIVIMPMRIS